MDNEESQRPEGFCAQVRCVYVPSVGSLGTPHLQMNLFGGKLMHPWFLRKDAQDNSEEGCCNQAEKFTQAHGEACGMPSSVIKPIIEESEMKAIEKQMNETFFLEYRRQASEPIAVSQDAIERMRNPVQRSESCHPQRQNSESSSQYSSYAPQIKRKIYGQQASSSGYVTGSRESYDSAMTGEDVSSMEVNIHSNQILRSNGVDFEQGASKGNDSDIDFRRNGAVCDKSRDILDFIEKHKEDNVPEILTNQINSDNTEYNSQNMITTRKEDKSEHVGNLAPVDQQIPIHVADWLSSPAGSLSDSESVELSSIWQRMHEVENIFAEYDFNPCIPHGEMIDPHELEILFEDLENTGHIMNTDIHTDKALSIIAGSEPSLTALKVTYTSDVCSGDGVWTELELNKMLLDKQREAKIVIMQEMLRNGESLEKIEEVMCTTSIEADYGHQSQVHQITEEESFMMKCLQTATQCFNKSCTNFTCQHGKHLLEWLEDMVHRPDSDSVRDAFCREILHEIAQHSKDCYSLICTVPCCAFFHELISESEDVDFADLMVQFIQQYMPGIHKPRSTVTNTEEVNFIQFDEGYSSMPSEDIDFSIIGRFETFKDVFLLRDLRKNELNGVLKKRRMRPERVDLLKQLRSINGHNVNVTEHLWAASINHSNLLFSCMPPHGQTLRKMLAKLDDELNASAIQRIKTQLRSVSTYLHKNQIMYLNWASDHVLVRGSRKADFTIVLFNFDSSYVRSMNDRDFVELLNMNLPYYLIPPEAAQSSNHKDSISFPESDLWGIGCLLYEVCSGKPLFCTNCHLPNEQQMREAISRLPDILKRLPVEQNMYNCIRNLLAVNPQHRRFLQD